MIFLRLDEDDGTCKNRVAGISLSVMKLSFLPE